MTTKKVARPKVKKALAKPPAKKKTATKRPAAKKVAKKAAPKKTAAAKRTTPPKKKAEAKEAPRSDLWPPGESSTDVLGQTFLSDLMSDWKENGAGVIEICRTTKPEAYLRLIAAYAPKELRKTINPLDSMSDDELKATLKETLEAIRALGIDPGGHPGTTTEDPAGNQ